MTNFEKLRQMNSDELANIIATDSQCNMCIYFKTNTCPKDFKYGYEICEENIKAWLDSEVEE